LLSELHSTSSLSSTLRSAERTASGPQGATAGRCSQLPGPPDPDHHTVKLGFVYDARWPQAANQLLAAGYTWHQTLWALGLIDDQGRLLPRDDDQRDDQR